MTPSDYAKAFKKMCEMINREYGQYPTNVFIDPSARGLAEEIKRICPFIKLKNAPNAVELGIGRVQKVMALIRLFLVINKKSLSMKLLIILTLKKSIENGQEKPLKEKDHTMDAMRYYIMGLWKYIRRFLPPDIGNEK